MRQSSYDRRLTLYRRYEQLYTRAIEAENAGQGELADKLFVLAGKVRAAYQQAVEDALRTEAEVHSELAKAIRASYAGNYPRVE